jgi:hypothetical protein
MTTPNAEVKARTPQQLEESLRIYVKQFGDLHEKDCPLDDTCNCKWKQMNADVNTVCDLQALTTAAFQAGYQRGRLQGLLEVRAAIEELKTKPPAKDYVQDELTSCFEIARDAAAEWFEQKDPISNTFRDLAVRIRELKLSQ